MNHDLSIIARLAADRQHAFRRPLLPTAPEDTIPPGRTTRFCSARSQRPARGAPLAGDAGRPKNGRAPRCRHRRGRTGRQRRRPGPRPRRRSGHAPRKARPPSTLWGRHPPPSERAGGALRARARRGAPEPCPRLVGRIHPGRARPDDPRGAGAGLRCRARPRARRSAQPSHRRPGRCRRRNPRDRGDHRCRGHRRPLVGRRCPTGSTASSTVSSPTSSSVPTACTRRCGSTARSAPVRRPGAASTCVGPSTTRAEPPRRAAEYWTPLGLFGVSPLGDGTTYFYADATAADVTAAIVDLDLERFRSVWTDVLPACRGVLDRIAGDGSLLVNAVRRVDCDTFVDGRLVLLGDAAHAMEPTLGQGANSAFVDAAVLAEPAVASAADVDRALVAYDARRQARNTVRAAGRRGAARLAALHSSVAASVRNRFVRLVSAIQGCRAAVSEASAGGPGRAVPGRRWAPQPAVDAAAARLTTAPVAPSGAHQRAASTSSATSRPARTSSGPSSATRVSVRRTDGPWIPIANRATPLASSTGAATPHTPS